ncbi:hypothetical protein [Raoultella ornithinolytica]|uniref:hypothetical protein n=1 Tax=Raoultella ornithinolytica TaxID=54291 RepID=UPI00247AF3A0|nr:hypothetical protein [Raoultella ornithinolytica]MDH7608484.1 hypothetical protein [Raoultella ornithinolytica]
MSIRASQSWWEPTRFKPALTEIIRLCRLESVTTPQVKTLDTALPLERRPGILEHIGDYQHRHQLNKRVAPNRGHPGYGRSGTISG